MLSVFAAGSLRPAFAGLDARFTYDNARALAARIEGGERPDVFCSASPADPARLHALGLLGEPVVFARNRVVIAVRREAPDPDLRSARLAIEVAGVPLGDYTRELFDALRVTVAPAYEETIVDAVADRVLSGDADAGVLYATDVAARPALRAVAPGVDVVATYVAGVVTPSPGAAAFVAALPDHPALVRAGFQPRR
ncbi:MAG TPA: substrate-binding domain-containing protein [Solirubrobacter sp.]|nr:substrate-binding domain-containing protein [Solirubrobacter sp.]